MTHEPTGRGRAAIVEGDVEFDGHDAELLREIHQTGSVAAAATALERSRARALTRIETLEGTFGQLVERHRGGSGGGGSQLTDAGGTLLDRYDRLSAAVSATASVPETVLSGSVVEIDGEMASIETDVGTLRGLHEETTVGDDAHLRIGADAVTIHEPGTTPEPDATSARNRLEGVVAEIDRGETVCTVSIDVDGVVLRALLTEESARRLEIADGCRVALTWKATATRIVPGVGG